MREIVHDYRVERIGANGSIRIVVPRELVSPNTWQGFRWQMKARIRGEWEQFVWLALTNSKMRPSGKRIRVRVTVERGTPSARNFLRDDDNLRFCVKPLLDALKNRGLITNDSRKWIELPTPTQFVTTDNRYWTYITIDPLEDAPAGKSKRKAPRAGQAPPAADSAPAAPASAVEASDKIRPLADRFWPKVDSSGGPDACWPWTGAKSQKTSACYGVIREGGSGRMLLAHRVALFLTTGEMPADLDACHKCDNPICCNPAHLTWASHRENMRDYAAKYGGVAREKRPAPPRPMLDALDELEAIA